MARPPKYTPCRACGGSQALKTSHRLGRSLLQTTREGGSNYRQTLRGRLAAMGMTRFAVELRRRDSKDKLKVTHIEVIMTNHLTDQQIQGFPKIHMGVPVLYVNR